jgi:hypothetical protein
MARIHLVLLALLAVSISVRASSIVPGAGAKVGAVVTGGEGGEGGVGGEGAEGAEGEL